MKLKSRGLRIFYLVVLMSLLVLSPLISVALTPVGTTISPQYSDHGFAALATGDRVTMGSLEALTGGNLSVTALEGAIQKTFLSLNVREVLLDIGWENFTAGSPSNQTWVNNWLTASDVMGISNVFYVGQLTKEGFGSPWVDSLLSKDPTVATYYYNGTRAPFVSLDSPEVARYLEIDLGKLYSYYGAHPSWVGLSTGSSQGNPYYATGSSAPVIGYSNLSISSFVNSPYYNPDVNGTGYLPNGALDSLWSEFRAVQPAIVLSSGLWMTSSTVQLYGSGTSESYVEMRFQLPINTTDLQVGWYGQEIGSPGALIGQVYGDAAGLINRNQPLGNATVLPSGSSTSLEWQSGINLHHNYTAGYYWVVFSSPSSTSGNDYSIYMKNYLINNATAFASEAYYGPGLVSGSSILWLKDGVGKSLSIYPYQEAAVGAPLQVFTANHEFTFNTLFLFLSDRAYNTANATVSISDLTSGNKVVATGVLSQVLVHGLQNWVPISLNGSATTIPGHQYQITVDDPSISWTPVMRFVSTNPPQAGFQNQSQTLLFQLANLDWSQGHRDWTGMVTNGNDAVTAGHIDAVRFSPTKNETVNSVQILTASNYGTTGNYTSGTFSAAIWGSNSGGTAPKGPPLEELSVPASAVPLNGFLNVTGFNAKVTAGQEYWIVFVANSTDKITLARFASSYAFLVLGSNDGGSTWSAPAEGPTDWGFTVTLSKETIGTFVAGSKSISLTSDGIFAQSFIASSNSSVEGVFLGPLTPGPHLLVSINPTGPNGEPAVSSVGFGVYDAGNITLDVGPEFVQFSSVAHLYKGQEYWIVIHPLSGNYQISPLVYLNSSPNVPSNSSAVISSDNGLTWTDLTANTTSMLPDYLLETAPIAPAQFNTLTMYNDLSANHNFSVYTGLLKGWNAYVQVSELSTFNGVAEWLSSNTGRTFEFYGNAQANVLNQLKLNNFVTLPDFNSSTTCGELLAQENSAMVSGDNRFQYAPLSLLQNCGANGVASLAQQMNYTPYVGQSFGLSTSNSVLVVGDQSASALTGYLSNAYNAKYVNANLNPKLQVGEDFTSFKVILWVSPSNQTISSTAVSQLSSYVRSGGELLTTDGALANLTALQPKVALNVTAAPTLNASLFLAAATAHTGYASTSFRTSGSPIAFTARSTNLIISEHTLGSGRIVFVGLGGQPIAEIGDELVLLSNMISSAAGAQPPFWYGATASHTSPPESYSVEGAPGGPVLVLVDNPSTSSAEFSLSLNGSYYGVPADWKTVEIPTLNVTEGSGSNIRVQTTVPPGALVGVVVVPSSEPHIAYSNALVQRQFAYPDQSFYYVQGTRNQSVLVMISANETASQVLLDDNVTLHQASSLVNLYGAASGWYFDEPTHSLFVKYSSNGVDSIRFVFYAVPAAPPVSLPQQMVVTILEALVAVEAVTLTFLAIRVRRGRTRPKPPISSQ